MIHDLNEAVFFIIITVLFAGYIYYRLKFPNDSEAIENIEYDSNAIESVEFNTEINQDEKWSLEPRSYE